MVNSESDLEKIKREMLLMREAIRGKSISLRCLKIIDERLVRAGIMKEEDSIQHRLYNKRIKNA
jgi:hypothetical protein